jgi:mono/diheme cytochrome c family protein
VRSAGLLTTIGMIGLLPALGCQQRMAMQPSYKPLDPSTFFPDERSARPLPAGTVPRGYLRTDNQLFLGKKTRSLSAWAQPAAILGNATTPMGAAAATAVAEANEYADDVDVFPFPITREVLQEGHDRFMIYCVVCHDPLGTGQGKIVERGYTPPPSYHIERLRHAPVGHFFDVMTNGYGSMPDYRQQLTPRQRWAVAAYIRALQLSQHFPEKDLSAEMRAAWQKQTEPGEKAP